MATPEIVTAAVPLLASVITNGALVVPTLCPPNEREVGDRVKAGPAANPTPVRPAVCGLPVALSVTLSVAVLVPGAVGPNVTVIVQDPPTGSVPEHPVISLKSPTCVPVIATPETVTTVVPVLDSATPNGTLLAPTLTVPKTSELGVSATDAIVPVPVRRTSWGPSAALSEIARLAVRAPPEAGLNVTGHDRQGAGRKGVCEIGGQIRWMGRIRAGGG